MKIPDNVKTYELISSTLWFGEDGILYSIPKRSFSPNLSLDEIKAEVEKLKTIKGSDKVCMIAESDSFVPPPNKIQRDYISKSMPDIVKALAIVTTSPVAKVISNLFFGLKPPSYPAKVFSNEKDAKEWIKQYQ